jgi:hypothetical protein
MDWIQVLTIIFSILGMLYWFRADLKTDISRLEGDIKSIEGDIKSLENDIKSDVRSQTARTDKLYEMFIQLQRENNDLIKSLPKNFRTDP